MGLYLDFVNWKYLNLCQPSVSTQPLCSAIDSMRFWRFSNPRFFAFFHNRFIHKGQYCIGVVPVVTAIVGDLTVTVSDI
jgi:hypothetical protein